MIKHFLAVMAAVSFVGVASAQPYGGYRIGPAGGSYNNGYGYGYPGGYGYSYGPYPGGYGNQTGSYGGSGAYSGPYTRYGPAWGEYGPAPTAGLGTGVGVGAEWQPYGFASLGYRGAGNPDSAAFYPSFYGGYAYYPYYGSGYYPESGTRSPLPNIPGLNTSPNNYLSNLEAATNAAVGRSPASATVIDTMSTTNKPAPATISVIVPAGGQVWFNQTLSPPKSGSKWSYKTETLEPGKTHKVDVKATWKENGEDETYTLRVPVEAGDSLTVDLHARR